MSTNPIRFPTAATEVQFNDTAIREIVSDLIVKSAQEVESESIEIKGWCRDERDLAEKMTEACSCIANTHGGFVLVGVADSPRCQSKFSRCPYPVVNTAWLQSRIYDLSRPPIDNATFDVSSLLAEMTSCSGNNLFAIRVPKTRHVGGHITTKGVSKIRIGKECVPQYTAEDDRTSAPAPFIGLQDLSTTSIEWAMAQHQKHFAVPPTWASQQDFLEQERLVRQYLPDEDSTGPVQVSLAAVLLFGKPSAIQSVVPFSETIVLSDREANPIRIRKNIIDTVRELCIGENSVLRSRLPRLSPDVLKELVVNAYIHRCYRTNASVTINASGMDGLEIRSPGILPAGLTVKNFLYAAPVYRNLLLANGARFSGLCDKIGRGIDLIFRGVLSEGLPFPEFESADNNFTARIALAGSAEFKQFLRTRAEILSNLDEVIVLRILWAKTLATAEDLFVAMQRKSEFGCRVLSEMCRKNMIEPVDQFYRLSPAVRHDIENVFRANQLSLDGIL
jgi:ATP-dependent DNA helicase RecG